MRKNNSQGFSLFEVLTVLVILVILLSIAYPYWHGTLVSAQRATALSHLKQLSQCVFFYINDNDGNLPSGYVKNSKGGIKTNGIYPIPAIFPPNSPDFEAKHKSHWSNQLFVYAKRPEIYTAPGMIESEDEEPYVAFTYNGYLHDYPLEQIMEPSRVILFWCGVKNMILFGRALTNPYLKSDSRGPIKYGDAGVDLSGDTINSISSQEYRNIYFQGYGGLYPVVCVDGSAKAIKLDQINQEWSNQGAPNKIRQSARYVTHFSPR